MTYSTKLLDEIWFHRIQHPVPTIQDLWHPTLTRGCPQESWQDDYGQENGNRCEADEKVIVPQTVPMSTSKSAIVAFLLPYAFRNLWVVIQNALGLCWSLMIFCRHLGNEAGPKPRCPSWDTVQVPVCITHLPPMTHYDSVRRIMTPTGIQWSCLHMYANVHSFSRLCQYP